LTTTPTQNIPHRRRVGPIITQRAEEKNDGLPAYIVTDSSAIPKAIQVERFLIFFLRLCNSSSSGLLCLVACVVVVGTFGCSLRGISNTLCVERALIVVLVVEYHFITRALVCRSATANHLCEELYMHTPYELGFSPILGLLLFALVFAPG
jgi:hypothetical protein